MDVREIEAPEMKFNLEIFDINAEVQHVYRGLIETAQMKNIHLIDDILKLPLNVKLDRYLPGRYFRTCYPTSLNFRKPTTI